MVDLEDVRGSAKALRAAAALAFEELIESDFHKASAKQPQLSSLTITVGGLDQIWKLRATREQFRTMRESMSGVTQKSYTTGLAVFEVMPKIPLEELAEEIVMDAPERLQFQVLHISAARLELKAMVRE